MKNVFLSAVLVFITTISANAQLREGHFVYKIEYSATSIEKEYAIESLRQGPGLELELFFKDEDTRSEIKLGSKLITTTITNGKTEDYLVFMGQEVGNKAAKTTFTELGEMNFEKPAFEIVLVDETKTIEGYLCKKAIINYENGSNAIFWYTNEIIINKRGMNFVNEEVPGFPLEYESNEDGVRIQFILTFIEKSVGENPKKLFNVGLPDGYELVSMEEFTKMGM